MNKIDLINYDFEKITSAKEGDMRLHNKKKQSNPHDFIMNFLDEHKTGSEMEIFKEFQKAGFTYSKVGIHEILKKMEKNKIIKNIAIEKKHPRYEIIDTAEFKTKKDAYAFKDQISANIITYPYRNELDMIKEYPDDYNKKIVSELIFQFGIISLYTCLASYRRNISPKYGIEKNKKLHDLWLRNAMSFENNKKAMTFSKLFNSKLLIRLIEEAETKVSNRIKKEEDREKYKSKEITQKDLKKASKDLEKTFSEMFPDWYDNFQSSERVIDTLANQLMRRVCIDHPEYLLP